jgi:steroid delta-isomerase-like uncharacterized protein
MEDLAMSTPEQNKQLAHRLPTEALNKGNLAAVDDVVAPNAIDHNGPPGFPAGREGWKQYIPAFRKAFPDLQYTIENEIAEGDRVVLHTVGRGTMKGDFMGMHASGKQATWTEIHIFRFKDGKVVEHWSTMDMMGMLQQLGFIPAMAQA